MNHTQQSRRQILAVGSGALALSLLHAPALAVPALSFDTLYGAATAQGLQLTKASQALVGQTVVMKGFMAPPLKVDSDFFVLTRFPMSTCPFCSNAADWPTDIVVVRLKAETPVIEPSYEIVVTGLFEASLKLDPGTGFASLLRIVDATWTRV